MGKWPPQMAGVEGYSNSPCSRVFPKISVAQASNCAQAGIISPITGLIGMQSLETIKWITELVKWQ